jgi:hypothetical protein
VVVGKLAEAVISGGAEEAFIPDETQAFQFLDSECGHTRCLSLLLQPILPSLISHPISQFGIFAVFPRNSAVPVDSAIVGKLAQTDFPCGTVAILFEAQAFQFLNTENCHG